MLSFLPGILSFPPGHLLFRIENLSFPLENLSFALKNPLFPRADLSFPLENLIPPPKDGRLWKSAQNGILVRDVAQKRGLKSVPQGWSSGQVNLKGCWENLEWRHQWQFFC